MTTLPRQALTYDPRKGQAVFGPTSLFPLPETMPTINSGEQGYGWSSPDAILDTRDFAQGTEHEPKHQRIALNDKATAGPYIALVKGDHATKSYRHIRLHPTKPLDPDLPVAGLAGLWNSRNLAGLLWLLNVVSLPHVHLPIRFLTVDKHPVAVKWPRNATLIVPPGLYCVLAKPLPPPVRDKMDRWGTVRREYFPDDVFRIAVHLT